MDFGASPKPITACDFIDVCYCSYRYDLDNHPSGASYTTSVCPNKETFGEFINNTAHTCNEFGLRIWETYLPYVSRLHAASVEYAPGFSVL